MCVRVGALGGDDAVCVGGGGSGSRALLGAGSEGVGVGGRRAEEGAQVARVMEGR